MVARVILLKYKSNHVTPLLTLTVVSHLRVTFQVPTICPYSDILTWSRTSLSFAHSVLATLILLFLQPSSSLAARSAWGSLCTPHIYMLFSFQLCILKYVLLNGDFHDVIALFEYAMSFTLPLPAPCIIFLQSTHHHLTYIFYLFSASKLSCWLMCPKYGKQCLALSRCSINIY